MEARDRHDAVGVMTFIVLGLLLPLVVVDSSFYSGGLNAALSLLVVEISALRLSLIVAAGEPRILWLGAHLFIYPFLGIAALAQTTSGIYPLDGVNVISRDLVTSGLVTTLLGLVAFEAGSIVARRPILERAEESRVRFSEVRVVLVALIGLAFLAYQVNLTGFAPFLSSREEAGQALAGGDAGAQLYELTDKTRVLVLRAGTHIPVFIALLGLIAAVRSRTWDYGKIGRPATVALMAVLVAANVLANNPLGNSRFWFGVVLLGLLGVLVPWRRARGMRTLTFGALAVFILAFGLLDFARRAQRSLGDLSPRVNYVENGTYSAFQTIMNGDAYLLNHAHTHGAQLLSAVLNFVPRSVWPGKRPDTGFVIDPTYNRSATLWTEFRVDFGLVGMIVGFVVIGVVFSRLESRYARQDLAQALLLPLLAGFVIFLLRGSLLTVMGNLYPLLFFYWLALSRAGRKPAHGPRDAITGRGAASQQRASGQGSRPGGRRRLGALARGGT